MQKIRIDFDNPGLPQHISAVENDSQSRFFQATLYENGKAYTAPEGATYSIMYRGFGPQNQGWYDTINDGAGKRAACAVSGNVVTCEIARQALQVPGHVSIVLCVTTRKGYMLKSWPIECDCKNDRYDSTVEIQSFFYITRVSNADWNQAIQAWEDLKNTIDPTLSISGKAADAAKVGEAVGQVKEDLDDINFRMTPEVKYTNWFGHTREVTNGYYLNYTNGNPVGNASYGYSEYYPIKRNTKYYANGFGAGAQFCFYNLSKKFISGILLDSGVGEFQTPNDCDYIRYSIALSNLPNPITVIEGESVGAYTPYEFMGYKTIEKRILEVGAKYPYKTVMSAVDDAVDGDVVFIYAGTYDNEIVDASKKTISIIGEDRDRVIIKNDFGTYTRPPVQMASGLLKNVTLIAVDTGKPSTDADGTRPYALHCDYDILAGKSFRVENCILRSWLNSGVGFGLRLDGKMSFYNCIIESKAQRVALFGHDSPKESLAGNQYLSIKDCVIDSSYDYAVRFDSQRIQDANIYLVLINNTVVDSNDTPNSAYNNSGSGQATAFYNFNNLIGYHNDKKSHGNTIENWNYVK